MNLQSKGNDTTKLEFLNKVPEITIYFWIIKVLCTTIGETAADFLNVNLNFGLTGVSAITGLLLVIALFFQFKQKRYISGIYWLTVTLVSVFGTLVTDNLTDKIGLPLQLSTLIFGILLGGTFLVWYKSERTLSMHSIFTKKRELFYWLAILFTFALGTASGDLLAEGLGLGYLTTAVIISTIIAVIAVARKFRLNSVLSFWIIYIMTRPLGASIGDYLSQPASHGGLGFGVTLTSAIFLVGILATVIYLSITKRDVTAAASAEQVDESTEKGGLIQTVVVLALFLIVGGYGYYKHQTTLEKSTSIIPTATKGINEADRSALQTMSPLGDLSVFQTITQSSLDLLNKGDQSGATTRIGDLEYEWDKVASKLKSKDREAWTTIDGRIDTVLRELRAVHPNIVTEKSALVALLGVLK